MSHAGCLVGHICQLNYGWGGLVETLRASQRIAFSGSTLPLRIGQEVGFRLRQFSGKVEAVDLSPLRSQSSPQRTSPLHALLQGQDGFPLSKLTSAIWQQQIRRLQRGILKFSNAAKAEQCKLVLEAERLLGELLGQPDLDGDSLCQLIRRCASWLHAPVFKALAGVDEASPSDEQQDPVNLQRRIRQLLIRALNHLDLSDGPTFEAVEAALRYMAVFVQRLEENQGSMICHEMLVFERLLVWRKPTTKNEQVCFRRKGGQRPSLKVQDTWHYDVPKTSQNNISDTTIHQGIAEWLFQIFFHPGNLQENQLASKPLHPHAAAMRQWRRLRHLLPASLTMPGNTATEVKPEGMATSDPVQSKEDWRLQDAGFAVSSVFLFHVIFIDFP